MADSRLKLRTSILINALGSNTCLAKVDLSGNGMEDIGAKMLSKALQINSSLRCSAQLGPDLELWCPPTTHTDTDTHAHRRTQAPSPPLPVALYPSFQDTLRPRTILESTTSPSKGGRTPEQANVPARNRDPEGGATSYCSLSP